MKNRRHFLRSLAVASAALYLRFAPSAVAEVPALEAPKFWMFTLTLDVDGKTFTCTESVPCPKPLAA